MSKTNDFIALVLAAGQGTRMQSDRPKVLFELLGRPLVSYPVEAALGSGARQAVVVVGHERERVQQALRERFDQRVLTAVQPEQLGTADAARSGARAVPDFDGWFLILYGDCPLVTAEALVALMGAALQERGPLAMLTSRLDDPTGYGRIVRDARGLVSAVREQRDCSEQENRIREINPGVYAVKAAFFRSAIQRIENANAQQELYLTDLVELAARAGEIADVAWEAGDLLGVNDRYELADCERVLRQRVARAHALAGVTVRDPLATYIDADVVIEPEAVIEPGVTLRGSCRIESGARVDVGCVLTDVTVRAGAQLLPYTVATNSEIGQDARIGPFSHLRPDSRLGPEVHLGNFVETKKTSMGRGAKANHLSYLGDGVIGERVNVGAGTIFCNYDGFGKYTTVLEDDCFIGSDSQIIAPLTVGRGSYVATGATLTMDVPPESLAIARASQENKEGMAPRLRRMLEAKKRKHQQKK